MEVETFRPQFKEIKYTIPFNIPITTVFQSTAFNCKSMLRTMLKNQLIKKIFQRIQWCGVINIEVKNNSTIGPIEQSNTKRAVI